MSDNRQNKEPETYYLTRGALLVCEHGTHKRRLNLKNDHGVILFLDDEYRRPLVDETDCVFGEDENIGYFGICQSKCFCGEKEEIILKKYVEEGEEEPEDSSIITGTKCVAQLENTWRNVKMNALVEDSSVEISRVRASNRDYKWEDLKNSGYRNLVTTDSYIYCSCGKGRIFPVTSGIEYTGEKDVDR